MLLLCLSVTFRLSWTEGVPDAARGRYCRDRYVTSGVRKTVARTVGVGIGIGVGADCLVALLAVS